MKNYILWVLTVAAGIVVILYMAHYAEGERAKLECRKLQDQARVYKNQGFYITEGEKLQCDYYKTPIDAPVGVRPLFKN